MSASCHNRHRIYAEWIETDRSLGCPSNISCRWAGVKAITGTREPRWSSSTRGDNFCRCIDTSGNTVQNQCRRRHGCGSRYSGRKYIRCCSRKNGYLNIGRMCSSNVS